MSDNYMILLTSPTLVNGNFPSLPILNNHQQNGPIPNAIPNAMPNSGNSSHLTSHTSTPQPLTINANLHSNSTSGPSSSSYEDQQTILSSSIPNSHVTNNNIHHHNNSNNNNSNNNNHNNHSSANSNNPASHPSGNSTSNANHQHSINGPPGNNQFILKITNIPKDVTVRESRLIFSLVIDDIVKIELNQENEQPRILAVFKNFNTCVTTYKLLNNKYLFNESPIIVEIDDMFLQTNQNNQNSNTTGTTNNNNNNEEYLSAPKSSIASISSASASASAPNSSNSNRSRFIFNDPFNNDLDLNLNNLNLNGGNANNANLMNWQDSHSQPPTPLNNLGFDWNAKQNNNNQANNQPTNQPTNANNNGSSNGNNSYDNANSKNNRRTSSAFFQSNFSNNLLNNSFMNSNYQPLNLVQSNQPSQPLPNSQSNSISGPVPSQVGQVSGQGKGQVSQQVPTQQVPTQQVQNQQVPTQQVQNQQVPSQVQNQGQVGQIPSNGTTNQPSQTVQGSSNNGSTVTSPNQQVTSSSSTLLRKDIPDLSLLARVPPPANPADQNPPCNTLYVGNLPPDATEQELRNLFSPQKGFRRLSFRTKTTNSTNSTHGPMCFVEFEDVAHATKALADLYGRILPRSSSSNGKGGIRLSFSKNPLGVRGPQRRSSSNQVNGGFGYNNYHVKP